MQLISKAFCQPAVEGEGREKPLVKNIFNIQGGLFYRRKKKKRAWHLFSASKKHKG